MLISSENFWSRFRRSSRSFRISKRCSQNSLRSSLWSRSFSIKSRKMENARRFVDMVHRRIRPVRNERSRIWICILPGKPIKHHRSHFRISEIISSCLSAWSDSSLRLEILVILVISLGSRIHSSSSSRVSSRMRSGLWSSSSRQTRISLRGSWIVMLSINISMKGKTRSTDRSEIHSLSACSISITSSDLMMLSDIMSETRSFIMWRHLRKSIFDHKIESIDSVGKRWHSSSTRDPRISSRMSMGFVSISLIHHSCTKRSLTRSPRRSGHSSSVIWIRLRKMRNSTPSNTLIRLSIAPKNEGETARLSSIAEHKLTQSKKHSWEILGVFLYYSKRRASIGFNLAAFDAGKIPKTTPMKTTEPNEAMTAVGETVAVRKLFNTLTAK